MSFRRCLIVSLLSLEMVMIFILDVVPLSMPMEPLDSSSFFSSSRMTALLALPFSGGAFTFILRTSPSQPSMLSREDAGTTFIFSFIIMSCRSSVPRCYLYGATSRAHVMPCILEASKSIDGSVKENTAIRTSGLALQLYDDGFVFQCRGIGSNLFAGSDGAQQPSHDLARARLG